MGPSGMVPGLTVFLANKECPWRCIMCDLWRAALPGRVSGDDILAQLDAALASRMGRAMGWLKIYNAGSFFDRGAIPCSAYDGIARRCLGIDRLVVESHPSLVGAPVEAFRSCLPPTTRLEVAMGLETAHPDAHERLNKRTTPADFARAAAWLRERGMGVRLFLLTRPPFLAEREAKEWLLRSVDYALEIGGDPVVVIATRGTEGAMRRLKSMGAWDDAPLGWLEDAVCHGQSRRLGRVFADVWGLADRPSAAATSDLLERLGRLNRGQASYSEPG